MPGFPDHYQFAEFAQTHVHRVGDAIQTFCLLSFQVWRRGHNLSLQCVVFYPKFPSTPTYIPNASNQFSSVAQSCLTLWDSNESQHARPPYPSPTSGAYSNSCPSVMPSSHLILCRPPSPPAPNSSQHRQSQRYEYMMTYFFSLPFFPQTSCFFNSLLAFYSKNQYLASHSLVSLPTFRILIELI